jgi:peptidyl-prolyl cis-trans isomerase D
LAETSAADMANFIRQTGSAVPYADVAINSSALPNDIAARLDSAAVGEVYGPYRNAADDSFNAFRILAKTTAPDSIQYRQIQLSAEESTLADSIYTALKGGADFAELASKYGQNGEGTWLVARAYEGAALDADNSKYLNTLLNADVKALNKIELGGAHFILQVMDKKAMKNKVKVAVIKRPVEFSKDTYSKAYNEFSQFVAQNTTLEQMEKNAEESGYRLLERADFTSAEHHVGSVKNTREALKWVFDAKPGEVSPLYECGENDHLMVVGLEKVNKAGYRDIKLVEDMLKAEIIKDKKAEQLMAQLKGVSSIEQAKGLNGAVSDTVKHITFAAPTYVAVTHSSEPALGAAANKAEVNKLSAPVKGNAGVYVMQVINREKSAEKFDAKQEAQTLTGMAARYASTFINDLYKKANVKDDRYLFF